LKEGCLKRSKIHKKKPKKDHETRSLYTGVLNGEQKPLETRKKVISHPLRSLITQKGGPIIRKDYKLVVHGGEYNPSVGVGDA